MRCVDACVAFIAGEPVSLAECGEVLVPVQFPGDLLVACNLGVEIVELAPMDERCAFVRGGFELPVDRIAET